MMVVSMLVCHGNVDGVVAAFLYLGLYSLNISSV